MRLCVCVRREQDEIRRGKERGNDRENGDMRRGGGREKDLRSQSEVNR